MGDGGAPATRARVSRGGAELGEEGGRDAELGERRGEIVGQRGVDASSRALGVEGDRARVEGEPREADDAGEGAVVLAAAVVGVAEDGMAEVLEMPADLVKATGLGRGLDEGVAFDGAKSFIT